MRAARAAAIALGALAAAAFTPTETMVDRTFATFLDAHAIPGCSVALGTDGEVIVAKGYGRAGPGKQADAETVYRIGSLTKQFTAALALLARERALSDAPRLALDGPVQPYFPEIRLPDGLTVRHLLWHGSGLASYTDGARFRTEQFVPISEDAMVADIAGADRLFVPGAGGHYSNSNYYLLALLLERHHGVSFAQLMRRHLLMPLGMNDTDLLGGSGTEATGSDAGGFTDRRTDRSWTLGAGDLRSTVADLARWNRAFLGGGILSDESRALMLTSRHPNPEPAVAGERLAAGWMDISSPDHRRFYHQGFIHGFSSVNLIELAADGHGGRFVTVLCNRSLVAGLPALALALVPVSSLDR